MGCRSVVALIDGGEEGEVFLGQVGEFAGEARLSQQVLVVLGGHHDDLGDVVVRHGDGFGAGGEDAFADGAEVPRGLGGGDGPHRRLLSCATSCAPCCARLRGGKRNQ